MRTPGAAIVNTASIAGLLGSRHLVAYTASKHAVVGLTRTGALELGARGIRVNAICPAPIETNMVKTLGAGAGRTARERLTATLPLKRFGEPSEVAALGAFLSSPEAAYITGGIYTVDGARRPEARVLGISGLRSGARATVRPGEECVPGVGRERDRDARRVNAPPGEPTGCGYDVALPFLLLDGPGVAGEGIQALVVRRTDERLDVCPEGDGVRGADVGVEGAQGLEDLDELKVIRGGRPANHLEHLDRSIGATGRHEIDQHGLGLIGEGGLPHDSPANAPEIATVNKATWTS